MSLNDLTKYAYVRYAEAAVEHLFAVASGLDSAVVGEQQVLGQVRRAYAAAEANRTVGRVLHELAQHALSVGKRVHTETGIDAAGASVVSVALGMAETRLDGLGGRSAVVVGAGAMGGLSAKHLARAGVERVHVVNRSLPRARALAHTSATSASPPTPSRSTTYRPCSPMPTSSSAAPVRSGRWSRSPTCIAGWPTGWGHPRSRGRAAAAGDLRPRHATRRRSGGRGPARGVRRRHGPHPARAVRARGRRRRRGRPHHRGRRSGAIPSVAADGRGHPDGDGAAPARSRRRRGGAAAAGQPAAGAGRRPARRSRPDGAPRGRQAAACAHCSGQAAGQRARWRHLRRGAARTFRTRPAGRRRRRGGRVAAAQRSPTRRPEKRLR